MSKSTDKESDIISGCSLRFKTHILPRTAGQFTDKESGKNGATKTHDGTITTANLVNLNTQKTESDKLSVGTYSPNSDTAVEPITSEWHPGNLNLEFLNSVPMDLPPSSTQTNGDTGRWADSVSTHNISPSNLISFGESPPNLSDEGRQKNLRRTKREQKKNLHKNPSSLSPPSSRRGHHTVLLDKSRNPQNQPTKTSLSVACQSSPNLQSRIPLKFQLPHQAQSNFYNTPESNLMLVPQASRITQSESDYHCGFDVLFKEKVIIVGFKSGLEIYKISKRGISKISRLIGLRGGVFNAKILPWSIDHPSTGLFPLIALVIHGPANTTCEVSDKEVPLDDTIPNHGDIVQDTSRRSNIMNDINYYQTSVEIYSLSTGKTHIKTLLLFPKIPISITNQNIQIKIPEPVGSLDILADCGNLVVTSGITGETWIFKQSVCKGSLDKQFRCIGKIWTTVQNGATTETAPRMFDDLKTTESIPKRKRFNRAVLSLNGRWLAYCPSLPSTKNSLHAIVTEKDSKTKIQSLPIQTPPHLPEVNCGTETPGGESVMKQIAQVGTQNFIRASNYLAQQGLQAWTNYRNKPTSNTRKTPVTHNLPTTSASLTTRDPSLISIIDLTILAQNDIFTTIKSISPNLTFRVPYGCSFLSFSPDGLSLFSASSKGDLQFVWDLMQTYHTKDLHVSFDQIATGSRGPHVRQIAQFSRMTVARIVDVAWTSPFGERAAMVTEPGTIHVLDIPSNTFKWSLFHTKNSKPDLEGPSTYTNISNVIGARAATSAVNTLWTAARPLVNTRRRSITCLSTKNVSMTAGRSTQVLAAGISKSLGAATEKMNEIRRSVGIKLHLPRNLTAPKNSCIILLSKKRNDLIYALADGTVRIYTIKNRRFDRPADKPKILSKKFTEYRIPQLPGHNYFSDVEQETNTEEFLEFMETKIDELSHKARPTSLSHRSIPLMESSIPHAEIESNAPYQPFHLDKRVCLHIYTQRDDQLPVPPMKWSSSMETELNPMMEEVTNYVWVFGGPILDTKLDFGLSRNSESRSGVLKEFCALSSKVIDNNLRASDNAEESEYIMMNTARTNQNLVRPDMEETAHKNGFFEDDCEMLDFSSMNR